MTRALREDRAERDPGTGNLLPLVYEELRRLADRYLARERRDHTLQATALVHEAYVRLVEPADLVAGDREHFLALAARAMRRILVDHARRRNRQRRGGGTWRRVTLHEPLTPGGPLGFDLVDLNDVLERLSERDPRAAQVVELRFFGGLAIDEIAGVLGVSSGTVDNDWFAARAWLRRELRAEEGE